MLSISKIRENSEAVQAAINSKDETIDLNSILELDKSYRSILTDANDLRAERN